MGTTDDAGEPIGRRAAIKKAAVGAAAAGVVWSAPRIEGLTLRPSYAAAGSSVTNGDIAVTLSVSLLPFDTAHVCAPGASATMRGIRTNPIGVAFNYQFNNTADCTVVGNGYDITSPFMQSNGSTPGSSNAVPITAIANNPVNTTPVITIHWTCS